MRVSRRAQAITAMSLAAIFGIGLSVWALAPSDGQVVSTAAEPTLNAPSDATPFTTAPTHQPENPPEPGKIGRPLQCQPGAEKMVSIQSTFTVDPSGYTGPTVDSPETALYNKLATVGAPLAWSTNAQLQLQRGTVSADVAERTSQAVSLVGTVEGRLVVQALMIPFPPDGYHLPSLLFVCVKASALDPTATMPLPPEQWYVPTNEGVDPG